MPDYDAEWRPIDAGDWIGWLAVACGLLMIGFNVYWIGLAVMAAGLWLARM